MASVPQLNAPAAPERSEEDFAAATNKAVASAVPVMPPPPPPKTGTHWTGPNEYLLSQAKAVHKGLPEPAQLRERLRELMNTEKTNVFREPIRLFNLKKALKLICFYPPDRTLILEYIRLIASDDRKVCRLSHYLLRECAPLDDEQYKAAVEVLDAEMKNKSSARQAVALRTLSRLIKKRDIRRGINSADVLLRGLAGVTKQINAMQGSLASATSKIEDDPKRGGSRKKQAAGGRSPDEEELVDDGAGVLIKRRVTTRAKVTARAGKIVIGHTVMSMLRRCNRINPTSFRAEAYFYDLGIQASTPSTVRHTMALLEARMRVSPSSVGHYLLPRLPQKKPASDKRLVLEDLGAKIYYARILAQFARDPNLNAFVPTRSVLDESAPGGGGAAPEKKMFSFIFSSARKAGRKLQSMGQSTVYRRDDPLGVDFLEALLILLRNPSNRVLLEVIIGLSRRKWHSWTTVPVPEMALHDAPEYEALKLPNESTDVGKLSDSDSEEDFLKGDKLDDNVDDLPTAGAEQIGYFERKRERRRQQREMQAEANAPFYLRRLTEGNVPALEVVIRRILGAILSDEPIRRFGALRTALAIARAKIYTDTEDDEELIKKARATYYGTTSMKSRLGTAASAAATVDDKGPTFEEDAQQHVLEPLVKHVRYLVEEETSLFVRCKAAESFLLFVAAGAAENLEDLADDLDVTLSLGAGGSAPSPLALPAPADADAAQAPPQKPNGAAGAAAGGAAPAPRKRGRVSLKRHFASFVRAPELRDDVAFEALQPFLDSLVFEIPSNYPNLSVEVVEMIEEWAALYPTTGFCGRLFEAWERTLSVGTMETAQCVMSSVRRCAVALPPCERMASAAAEFLRRRSLDLCVLCVGGAGEELANGVPIPLPQAVGSEMETVFSLIHYGILVGASAEARYLFVLAMGGAALLAGDPFRICAYEKLCEVGRARGLGLRIAVEVTLDALDSLYSARERCNEARLRMQQQGGITSNRREKVWLQGVWKLAAEAAAAATCLLGCPPPPGWEPLGPEASHDVALAEEMLGDYREPEAPAAQAPPSTSSELVVAEGAPPDAPPLEEEAPPPMY